MTPRLWVIDTNVIVSGIIGANSDSPPARVVDAMLDGAFVYYLSAELLDEYSSILRRPRIARVHGFTDDELDRVLADLVANAVWREPTAGSDAPDPGDNHLWNLLAVAHPSGSLVTGDRLLVLNPPTGASVISPRSFVDAFLPAEQPSRDP